MGDRDTVAEPGGAELFAGYQVLIDAVGIQMAVLGDHLADQLEHFLLGAPLHTGKGALGGEYVVNLHGFWLRLP